MLPNWFVALPVDPNTISTLPAVPPGFRAFHPDDLHLTLSFLGACGAQVARQAFADFASELRGSGSVSFQASLGRVVPMGPKRRYSALSAMLDAGHSEAGAFLARFRDVVADRAGIARDERAPLPHVTVARPQRRATDEQRAVGLVWAESVILPGASFWLNRVALYTWSERRLPRLFQMVETVAFGE